MTEDRHAQLVSCIGAHSRPLTPDPIGIAEKTDPLLYIRAVLFDIYGCLLLSRTGRAGPTPPQSTDDIGTALSAAGWGTPKLPEPGEVADALAKHTRALAPKRGDKGGSHPEVDARAPWREVLGCLLQSSPKKLDAAAIERFLVELEARLNPVWAMPGLQDTLAGLRERGIKVGVASDAQFYTPLALEAVLGRPPEDAGLEPNACIYSYRVGAAQPSPRLYEEAMIALENEFAILSDEVLYVGPSPRDLLAAKAMGFRTALYAGNAVSARAEAGDLDGMREDPPDRTIAELRQLLDMLPMPKTTAAPSRLDLDADIDD
ncbi:HAD family hydrolase [Thiorhodococcus minor]|uniref:HAD family hydrolase n=1 Tax=Thiorhodococcus minor TaxID=57489 RepID=A0A6M0JWF4_9GAMM|nr:HAD family hydrolase [Thiorhodococcus minor]NEV61892.1 HAD family hydrolase [Thiorhodococcus minor]